MEIEFWCRFFILSICIRCYIALDHTKLNEHAMIAVDDNAQIITTEITTLATTDQLYRRSRRPRRERDGYVAAYEQLVPDDDNQDDGVVDYSNNMSNSKAINQAQYDYWGSYYDFLINESSYKFWAVFQLATAVLLVYSGFAALYYAKVNPQITEDYDDFLVKRRRRFIDQSDQPHQRPYFGFEPQNFQRILDAVAKDIC